MIAYNTKDWFTIIFRFHKSDTIRKLIWVVLGVCLYSGMVAYLELEFWQLSDSAHLKNITIMHNMLGFVISLLLVFRTNTAYERWWEGRKLWGALVNNSRNLAIKLHAMLPENDTQSRIFFSRMIPLYAAVLRNHLMTESTRLALDELSHPELEHLNKDRHMPNQVAAKIFDQVNHLYTGGKIKGEQLLLLNSELQSFTDICGSCERIKNTPIPFSYSSFIKKFIFIYVITLPFGYVFSLGYWVMPVVAFIFYVLASLELIAEEIEDPFGNDTNDLPTAKITENIKKHITEMLG